MNFFPAENLGAAGLMKANGMRRSILQIPARACNPHLSDIIANKNHLIKCFFNLFMW